MDLPILPPQVCTELQILDQAEGFRIGHQVKQADQAGRVISFACQAGRPGAWVLFTVPGSRIGELRRVQLADLAKVAR